MNKRIIRDLGITMVACVFLINAFLDYEKDKSKFVITEKEVKTVTTGYGDVYTGQFEIGYKNRKDTKKINYIEKYNTKYVAIRDIAEYLDGRLSWVASLKSASLDIGKSYYSVFVDKSEIRINGKKSILKQPSRLINSRTYIPEDCLKNISGLTYKLALTSTNKVAANAKKEFAVDSISIGDPLSKVTGMYGAPTRIDSSVYGFKWYIYVNNYDNYMQVGIKNNTVVGLYSNSLKFSSRKNIKIGQTQSSITAIMGNPIKYLDKNGVRYLIGDDGNDAMYIVEDYYITFFYDKYNKNTLTSILMVKKSEEDTLKTYYAPKSTELVSSFEKEVFDLTNSIRKRFGKPPFVYDDKATVSAKKHSKDMAENGFFNHINPKGQNPFERMNIEGIIYSNAAENIATGQRDSIYAHEAWMNSFGHRSSILGDYERLGVGVFQGGQYNVYYTQNFYTPLIER